MIKIGDIVSDAVLRIEKEQMSHIGFVPKLCVHGRCR